MSFQVQRRFPVFAAVGLSLVLISCTGSEILEAEPDPSPAAPSPDAPSPDAPSPDAPSPDAPSPDAPSPDAPSPDAPSPDAPSPDAPSPDAPSPDAPSPDAPSPDAPSPDAPSPDAPSPDSPSPDAPTPSSGCGESAPSDGEWSIQSGGRTRTFRVHLPPNFDNDTETPLVLSFHGHAISANLQAVVDKMRDVADDNGFVVVHPQGTGTTPSWNGGACCGYAKDNNIDDVAFVDDMIAELSASLCIDQRRIYANGLSNGGFFSYRLACERADTFAAVASVAGMTGILQCSPTRPIPIQHFHGTNDLIVPYNGNFAIAYLSVDGHVDQWRDHNGCSEVKSTFHETSDTVCEAWSDCDAGSEIQLCTIDDGGHQWPGGWSVPGLGQNTDTIFASDMMWDFFSSHTLPN